MKKLWLLLAVMAVSPALAQGRSISAAISAGQVGERYDGYMGFAMQPSPEVKREVYAINIRRRSLYTDLASQRSVAPQVVGIATGCVLLGQLPVGEAYLWNDGVWRRRMPGQPPPQPSYCAR